VLGNLNQYLAEFDLPLEKGGQGVEDIRHLPPLPPFQGDVVRAVSDPAASAHPFSRFLPEDRVERHQFADRLRSAKRIRGFQQKFQFAASSRVLGSEIIMPEC